MDEDRCLELAQLGTGVEAELLGEHGAALLEHAQRIGLPSGAVEGQHQLGPQSLAERMVGDEHLELADEPLMMGERELHFDPLFDEGNAHLLQTSDVRLRELLVGEVRQRCAAPQRLGLRERPQRLVQMPHARLMPAPFR